MILEGNQRGGAKNLALHLLKEENDYVNVHELRGFVSENLVSALNEAYAISRGTRAKKFLFSLSLNPPQTEQVKTSVFKDAIARVEDKFGLTGQPRAIVFHEKEGRRHAHAVWSRIDAERMKAIHLSHTKLKLMEISRDLYLKHGWTMPKGFIRGNEHDPNNFTLQQWQQSKRIGKDPRAIKTTMRDCWAASDSQAAFAQALKEQGYILAKGSRKGAIVAIDQRCEVFSVPKWVGIRIKDVRAKLTAHETLPSFEEAKNRIVKDMASKLSELQKQHESAIHSRVVAIEQDITRLKEKQRAERRTLSEQQEARRNEEATQRQKRFHKGLRGFFDRLTGKHRKIARKNEQETIKADQRDQQEKDRLIFEQLEQSRTLTKRLNRLQEFSKQKTQTLDNDLAQYHEIKHGRQEAFEYHRHPSHRRRGLER